MDDGAALAPDPAAATGEPTPSDTAFLTQEIRIATVMTGGVSLAIWMGGVARELNLLERASSAPAVPPSGVPTPSDQVQSIYRSLLDLLRLTVDVDVLSGTSAGGLNAAFLAYARANGGTLDGLRDVWLTVGTFEKLLRDPTTANPPSLLQGDGVLLPGVAGALEHMGPAKPRRDPADDSPHDPPPTDVFITTTLLTGETSRFTDANGTVVQDVDHRGVFKFSGSQLVGLEGRRAIALAARSSASFPAAFEPSFVPYAHEPAHDKATQHPAMQDYANITRDHWAADGGVLMNRPIRPLLQTIFERPASRQVRRVLLYVVPTTGPSPDPRKDPKVESFDEPLPLVRALLEDLGSALHQSISADLQAIQDHNDRVDSLGDTRLRLAELAVRLQECDGEHDRRLLTPELFADYRARQSTWLVRPLIVALMRAITTMPEDKIPKGWRTTLAPGGNAEEQCRDAAANAVAETWPSTMPETVDFDVLATFGRSAFEGAQAIVINMLRRAFVLADTPEQRVLLAKAVAAVHVQLPVSRPNLDAIVTETLASGSSTLTDAVEGAARRYAAALAGPAADAPGEPSALSRAWRSLAEVVADHTNRDLLRSLLMPAPDPGATTGGRATRRENLVERQQRTSPELETYVRYFEGDANANGGDHVPDVGTVAMRLFDLAVATRAVLPVAVEVDQPVELVQVSADTRTALAPDRAVAGRKLTGLQLDHFGAFYKSSWRANDWMWGRLDGAGWLVSLLLDPRRIATIAGTDAPPGGELEWFYDSLVELVGLPMGEVVSAAGDPVETRLTPEAIKGELAFVGNAGAPVPASLPLTSMWVALALQRLIAAEELPIVAREILKNPSPRTSTWATKLLGRAGQPDVATAAAQAATADVIWRGSRAGKKMRTLALQPPPVEPIDPRTVGEELRSCPVPDETLAQDLGEPLFTRTATKAVAVAAAALTTSAQPLTGLRPVLSALRTTTLAGYRAAVVTRGWPRKIMLLGLLVLAVGIVAAVQGGTIVGVAGLTVALVGAYLVAIATFSFGRRLILPLAGITVLGLLVSPACPAVRRGLFGTSATDLGVFGRDVIPWLRSPFWHVLVVIGGLMALVSIVGVVPRLFGRRARKA